MTLPSERTRAVIQMGQLAYSMLDPKKMPRIPLDVRMLFRHALKHYPFESSFDSPSNFEFRTRNAKKLLRFANSIGKKAKR
jgi:hypothetical protein